MHIYIYIYIFIYLFIYTHYAHVYIMNSQRRRRAVRLAGVCLFAAALAKCFGVLGSVQVLSRRPAACVPRVCMCELRRVF